MGITQASRKKAIIFHYVGEETCDVFETGTVPEPTDESDEYRTAVKAFADYFEPQKCVMYTPVFNCWHAKLMRVRKYRFGNKTANKSRDLISSPETQSYRAKPQPRGLAESCSLNGDRRRTSEPAR